MLRSIIICPDAEVSGRLLAVLTPLGAVTVLRVLDTYPTEIELARILRTLTPDMVFLSFESANAALEIVRFLDKEVQGIQITSIHRVCHTAALRDAMRAGVREFVEYPFERQSVIDSVSNSASLLEQRPLVYRATTQVFSFLPSKAGAGASTLALNVSAALARRPDMRVLLADFDLSSGMTRFLLKLQNEFSVLDAVERSSAMDESLWHPMVTSTHGMEVLHSGRVNPSVRIEGTQVHDLIRFMGRSYDAVCFDLSGNLERYSLDIMQESRRILLVCTAETPSLHLAREKLQFLKTLDLDSRVGVVLNRVYRKSVLGKSQVEEILGVPVIAALSNDYSAVHRAANEGTVLDPKSELGKEHTQFAASLLDNGTSPPMAGRQPNHPGSKNKFLEFFSVPTLLPR
jgi:pilus assembly protein CpaE